MIFVDTILFCSDNRLLTQMMWYTNPLSIHFVISIHEQSTNIYIRPVQTREKKTNAYTHTPHTTATYSRSLPFLNRKIKKKCWASSKVNKRVLEYINGKAIATVPVIHLSNFRNFRQKWMSSVRPSIFQWKIKPIRNSLSYKFRFLIRSIVCIIFGKFR